MADRKFSVLFILPFLLVLTGCWDDIELEERGFLAGVAVDLAEGGGEEEMFEVTMQLVVPSGLGSSTQGAGGDKAYRNLSQTGRSLFEINQSVGRQANREINIEHLDVVILSTEVASKKELFDNVVDVFIRQQNMRRGISIALVEGKAKSLLDLETEHEKLPARYIDTLMEYKENSFTIQPVRLGDLQEKMLESRSFVIPILSVFANNSINYSGVAVFRGETNELVEVIRKEDVEGRNFIVGENFEGAMPLEIEGDLITFLVQRGNSSVKLTNNDKENLGFQVDIKLSARIVEYLGKKDLSKMENLNLVKRALEKKVKTISESSIEKIKDDLQVDILDLDYYLKMHHYKLWEKVKDNWDTGENYFSKSDIQVEVNVDITDPGNSYRIIKEGE